MTAITPEEMFYRMHPEMAKDNSWLSYCVELESESATLRTRLAKTEHLLSMCQQQRDKEHELALRGAKNWMSATKERDEARQWAAKLYKENADLEATLALCRSAGHEISDIGFDALAENTSLRAQLAEARNKALDDAVAKCQPLITRWSKWWGMPADPVQDVIDIRDEIRALKDSGAYPADEISTGKEDGA